MVAFGGVAFWGILKLLGGDFTLMEPVEGRPSILWENRYALFGVPFKGGPLYLAQGKAAFVLEGERVGLSGKTDLFSFFCGP